MSTWKEYRKELNLSAEEENVVALEKELLRTLVAIKEDQGLSQAQLAEKCNVKQPVIARLETATHSPQVDTLLKILTPLGYTLQIVPMKNNR